MNPLIDELRAAYEELDERLKDIVERADAGLWSQSTAEPARKKIMFVVRSAAVVEQCFGGITSNLWDDPFEWTLDEHFVDKASVIKYLKEVYETMGRGFDSIRSDRELAKIIATPGGQKPILSVVLQSLLKANELAALAEYEYELHQPGRPPRHT